MAMHAYLHIDGVAGGSTRAGYEGWIACESVSWSLRGPSTLGSLSEIRFVKPEDAASPVLARLCVTAASLARAHFEFLRVAPDGAATRCYEIALENVTVANVATTPRGAEAPMETVVLTFTQARLTPAGQGDD